jgi:hypothetical protein
MSELKGEEAERVEVLTAMGGPKTLLHGDLWPTNAIVLSNGDGVRVRLIDRDEAAAYARLASLLVWSVAAAAEGDSDWLLERLRAIIEWVDAVKPVLPAR